MYCAAALRLLLYLLDIYLKLNVYVLGLGFWMIPNTVCSVQYSTDNMGFGRLYLNIIADGRLTTAMMMKFLLSVQEIKLMI